MYTLVMQHFQMVYHGIFQGHFMNFPSIHTSLNERLYQENSLKFHGIPQDTVVLIFYTVMYHAIERTV